MADIIALKIEDVTENINVLIISDISIYDAGTNQSTAILSIKSPLSLTGKLLAFGASTKLNSYNSINVGSSTIIDDLPDGLYEITHTVDGRVTTINHFRISKLNTAILKQMADFLSNECEEYTVLTQAYLFARCIQPLASDNKIKQAHDFYNRAVFTLNSVCKKIFK